MGGYGGEDGTFSNQPQTHRATSSLVDTATPGEEKAQHTHGCGAFAQCERGGGVGNFTRRSNVSGVELKRITRGAQ